MNSPIVQYTPLVKLINDEYSILHSLTNDELRQCLFLIQQDIVLSIDKKKALDDYLIRVFAIVKETARRLSEGNIVVKANAYDKKLAGNELNDFVEIVGDKAVYKNHWSVCGESFRWQMVHYDEQLLGGILLHYGYATEMATGEGKTLVATLPVFLNALTHNGVHLMTVNNYLSLRDFETTRPIYLLYGLTVGCIEEDSGDKSKRRKIYESDIVFGDTSSFVFDYLFDHIALAADDCVQIGYNFAIIDELDSVLIDEADTPHIISGLPVYTDGCIFRTFYPIVNEMVCENNSDYYIIDKLHKNAYYTEKGKDWLTKKLAIPELFEKKSLSEINSLPKDNQKNLLDKRFQQNALNQLLLAITVYERDEDYIIDSGKVKIIDHNTGRIKERTRWSYGLHTAIEVKENVEAQADSERMAVISLKNYFKLYHKISGMSGTIMSVKDELKETYNLKCVSLPTHRPVIRKDFPLQVFRTISQKNKAIVETIIKNKKQGCPTLVGCTSIKRVDEICSLLDEANVTYNKLDAKTLKKEAEIVAHAGINDTITVATSVAGRGTDIKLSPDARANGGLMVIGTELFDSERVDKQLQGRSGRQGDPGSSVFFVSLEDSILQNLSVNEKESLTNLSNKCTEGELSSDKICGYFRKAQIKSESYFESVRKKNVRKDDIIAPQRRKFYNQRNSVLFSSDNVDSIIEQLLTLSANDKKNIDKHLLEIYEKAKVLVGRSIKSNSFRNKIPIPLSDDLHLFVVVLDVSQILCSFDYFSREFKRQIILQIYDKEWGRFVIYMGSNLDSDEIEMLGEKYNQMMSNIRTIIKSRLLHAIMPFEVSRGSLDMSDGLGKQNVEINALTSKSELHIVEDYDLCPCGSGKKFCECHGIGSRRIKRRR